MVAFALGMTLLGCETKMRISGPAPLPPPAPAPAPAPAPLPTYITVKERIQFETDSSVLLEHSKVVLNDVVKVLADNPAITLVEVGGHTDSTGEKDKNLMLSQLRAESVRDYLVSQGIDTRRLRAMGYGDRIPVASNDNPAGREQNRRVEFRIIKQGP